MAQRFVLHPTHPQARLIRQAAAMVRAGGVVAYPTDSSYALGCRLDDAAAVRRIRVLRDLDERHHLALMCRDLADVGRVARLDNWQFRILRLGTPGSFTFLLPASREVPRRIQHARRSTIGVRVSDHPVVVSLIHELAAPMLTSTLILPGDIDPLNDTEIIMDRIGARIDLLIDAGPCPNEPTTVIDLAVDPPVLVRRGRGDPAVLGLTAGLQSQDPG
ncbi:MAG TPA: L-threonylcarbamoyladenylate synthase [Casimicrobiaceae bacterium]|nr:L-threonylcarbamoyladenylate synthase [Casimicrobiaceae bacterium]